jgi:hypothetical protein
VFGVALMLLVARAPAAAHDLERTQVLFTFARDGTFVLEVNNDPRWLAERLASVRGPFADRIVIWVDGREVRPERVELVADAEVATHRLRGRLPIEAKTLRWYYGLVIDPYPLTIRRADGRVIVEEVGGDAWSGTIDLTGQFERPARWPIYAVLLLAAAGLVMRLRSRKALHHGGHGG